MKPSLSDYSLYFVTDPKLHAGYTVLRQIELALQGGVKIVQIREKELPRADFLGLACRALELTRAHNAWLIINDSVEVTAASGADGVHLGQDDVPLPEAREILGIDAIIGVSVKTLEEAQQAESQGADYVAVNGVFPTATKEDLGYCPGLAGTTRICRGVRLPVIGIGGINLDNCCRVIESGAQGVAVVTAITMSPDMPSTCRSFLERINRQKQGAKR